LFIHHVGVTDYRKLKIMNNHTTATATKQMDIDGFMHCKKIIYGCLPTRPYTKRWN
jgi:hypothetical protein